MLRTREYKNIKVKLWRQKDTGYLCCELTNLEGDFILFMVSATPEDDECDVVMTALNCMSARDLALANKGVAG